MSRPILLTAGVLAVLLGIVLSATALSLHAPNGTLDIKTECKPTLMTIAYKAYSTPSAANGQYWLSKTVLNNSGQSSIKNIKISYRIPTYLDTWSEPDECPELLPNATAIFAFYPKLPPKVMEIHTLTSSELDMKIDYTDNTGPQEILKKNEFSFRGINEFESTSLKPDEIANWYDACDNDPMLASYVTPDDPLIKSYYGMISEKYGGVPEMGNFDDLFKLGQSIYGFMLQTGMTYSMGNDNFEKVGDVITGTQNIRIPREVVKNNTGLCIELAMLWASLGIQAGCKDVYLITLQHPGHCFPVFEAANGDEMPIEITAIGGGTVQNGNMAPQMTDFNAVVKYAQGNVHDLMNHMPLENFKQSSVSAFNVLSVRKLQAEGFRPPELPEIDVAAFRKQMNDIIAEHVQARNQQQPVAQQNPQQQQQQPGNNGNYIGWNDPTQSIMVPYPGNWQVADATMMQQLQQAVPGWQLRATDPQTGMIVNVFGVPAADPQAVMQNFADVLTKLQTQPQVGQPSQAACDGVQCVAYPLQYVSNNNPYMGVCLIVPAGNTTFIVLIASPVAAKDLPVVKDEAAKIMANIKVKH
jgi:hypothetical protein